MADDSTPNKRLIALEGYSARGLDEASRLLKSHFCRKVGGGISVWDSSSIFYEMGLGEGQDKKPSPRTLVLLYAADLSFRLQWQIRPALKEGQCVIAAPYMESIMAFGRAAELPLKWLQSLFRFAPQPAITYRIREPKEPLKKTKLMDGFAEFCSGMLRADSYPGDYKELRGKYIAYLDERESSGVCRTIPSRLPAPFLPGK